MNRLIKFFKSLDTNDNSYEVIYEGPMSEDDITIYDPTYWDNDVAYHISRTHKLTPDKATVTIKIPFYKLNISKDLNEVAVCDFVLRKFSYVIENINKSIYNRSRPDKENGAYYCFKPANVVLRRNASFFENYMGTNFLCIMIVIQFPYKKKDKAMRMTCKILPKAVNEFIQNFDLNELKIQVNTYDLQNRIRKWLNENGYCAFIANGSILPRDKDGNSVLNAVEFTSPPEHEIEIYGIKGMGIKQGVTVITGGGYSGKSTLLKAIGDGIYNHIYSDGCKFVVTDSTAMEIIAEDGRSVKNINISPFIKWIPKGNPEHFYTSCASGSTSQASNIIEAINYGCKLILIDEDKSATNFMIRDDKMKTLIKHEPITPFTERVREIFQKHGVSTILVIGGSSDYIGVADNIIMMDEFHSFDITDEARKFCPKKQSDCVEMDTWFFNRNIFLEAFTSYPENSGTENLYVSDMGYLSIGDEMIDIRGIKNIISFAQLGAIAFLIRKIELRNQKNYLNGINKININKEIEDILTEVEKTGLENIFSTFFGNFERWIEMPRKFEVLAVINRMRNVDFSIDMKEK